MCRISCCVAAVHLDEKNLSVDSGNLVFFFRMVAGGWMGLFHLTSSCPSALFDLSVDTAGRLAEGTHTEKAGVERNGRSSSEFPGVPENCGCPSNFLSEANQMTVLTTTTTAIKSAEKKHWLDAWHVTPSANRDYDFIDGLRGVAILMVIAAHHFYFNPNSGFAFHLAGNIVGTGGYGVTLFFALSGFLIAWPFWKRKVAGSENVVPRGYFQRRFWKIYPPLVLSILIFTPLFMYALNPGFGTSFIPVALRWLSGLAFLWPVSGKLNPVMWTLVLEAQFYLLLPIVFVAFKRLSVKASLVGLTVVFLVVPIIYRLATKQAPTFYPDINSHFPSGLDYFYLGILIAGLDAMGVVKKSWKWWGVAGCVLWPLALLVSAWSNMHPDTRTFPVAELENDSLKIAAACLILFIAEPQQWLARLLCVPGLRWCGIISYEWYLFHQPLTFFSRDYFGPANGALYKYALISGIPIAVSLIFSAAVYRFFSLPILRRGRSRNKA